MNRILIRMALLVCVAMSISGAFVVRAVAAPAKVGFILSTLQEERYQKDQKYFVDEAKKLGLEPIVVSADNNPQTQTAKVENLLAQGVKVLVIQPVNSGASSRFVTLAHNEKVAVISYDRLIEKAPVDLYLTEDAVQIGVLQAEAAVKATNGKGNYLILKGQAGHSVVADIMKGVHSVLDKYPNIKIIAEKNHDAWSPSLAMATTENTLVRFHNQIDAVLANNSGMAQGAVQALAAQNLTGKVFVAGSDADLSAIRNIIAGRQQFEIMMSIEDLARTAARSAAQFVKGEKPKSTSLLENGGFKVPTISMGVYGVTKDNIEERIIKTGFHDRQAVYGPTKKM